jgi:uncharacterized protein YbjT (DUF2867 family)
VDHVGHSARIAAARGASADHPIDFGRSKHEIEDVLRESTMPFAILRPTAFMEQHVHLFLGKPLLDRGFTVILGPGTKPRNFVAVRDIVPIAIRALMDEALVGRTIEVGGPENLSNREVALLYALRARKGRIVHLPLGVARAAVLAVRPFHEGIARVLDLALMPDEAWPEVYDPRAQWAEFPARLTTVDQFVDERVREWRRAGMGRRR